MHVFIVVIGKLREGESPIAVFPEAQEEEALACGQKLAEEASTYGWSCLKSFGPLERVRESELTGILAGRVIARWDNGDFVEIIKMPISQNVEDPINNSRLKNYLVT